jgi:hypothetical protein
VSMNVSARRRFPPPWSIEESAACFIVRDGDKEALAYVYFENERGRRSSAKLLTRRGVPHRSEHRQAAKRTAADIEGHSAAAELGQPGRLTRGVAEAPSRSEVSCAY